MMFQIKFKENIKLKYPIWMYVINTRNCDGQTN
jgi:hypothetical protein